MLRTIYGIYNNITFVYVILKEVRRQTPKYTKEERRKIYENHIYTKKNRNL